MLEEKSNGPAASPSQPQETQTAAVQQKRGKWPLITAALHPTPLTFTTIRTR